MTARRLISVLSVGLGAALAASATVVAQPKPAARKPAPRTAPKSRPKAPLAPAKDGAAGAAASSGSAAGSAAGSPGAAGTPGGEGSAVQMTEDPPPSDMTGTAENPDAPRSIVDPENPGISASAVPPPAVTGYPVEEVMRPITLPQNLSEVSIAPHIVVSPYAGSTALRARYGITSKVQLGLTYLVGAIFDDPSTMESRQGFHPGKAVGIDVTVMLQDWVGVQVGVPLYISPLALSLTLGAPFKLRFGDRFAIGGLDDFLNIKLDRFAPTFYQELQNATNANDTMTNTIKSAGELRVSLYGAYQYEHDLALIGRIGIQMEDFATGKTDGCLGECLTTFLSAGLRFTPRKYLDLGLSIGFDDLAHGGSFAPAGFLAFRI
jgi:hypothetical protein